MVYRLAEPEPSELERQASEVRRADRSVFVQELLLSSLTENLRLDDGPLELPSAAQLDANFLASVLPASRVHAEQDAPSNCSTKHDSAASDSGPRGDKAMQQKCKDTTQKDTDANELVADGENHVAESNVVPVSAPASNACPETSLMQSSTPVVPFVVDSPVTAPRAPAASREEVLRNKMRAMEASGSHERTAAASAASKH